MTSPATPNWNTLSQQQKLAEYALAAFVMLVMTAAHYACFDSVNAAGFSAVLLGAVFVLMCLARFGRPTVYAGAATAQTVAMIWSVTLPSSDPALLYLMLWPAVAIGLLVALFVEAKYPARNATLSFARATLIVLAAVAIYCMAARISFD